jgi:hypothetical protein
MGSESVRQGRPLRMVLPTMARTYCIIAFLYPNAEPYGSFVERHQKSKGVEVSSVFIT